MLWLPICLLFSCFHTLSASHNVTTAEQLFQDFVKRFHKPYGIDSNEYQKRFHIFKDNLHILDGLNSELGPNATTKYGITKFSDLTPEEFKDQYLHYKPTANKTGSHPPDLLMLPPGDNSKSLPLRIDWRDKKVVSSVKNQKSCGGCWAFSVAETIESQYAIATGKLYSLSPQEIIDCSFGYKGVLYGCRGGNTREALEWLMKWHIPLVSIDKYALTDKQQSCKVPKNGTVGVQLKSFTCTDESSHDENMMLRWLANHGPLSVAVDATNWNNYQSGIIQYHCGQVPDNHAVVIVGYDISGPIPYYIVKNSWGEDFGDKGYLYIRKGGNVCGIAKEVSTVDVYH